MNRYATIIGTGSYLPETVLTNFDLEKMVDTSDEWIRQRTGIAERRIAEDDIATSDLSVHAARLAIKRAQIDPLDIQMILVATVTPDTFFSLNRLLCSKGNRCKKCIRNGYIRSVRRFFVWTRFSKWIDCFWTV